MLLIGKNKMRLLYLILILALTEVGNGVAEVQQREVHELEDQIASLEVKVDAAKQETADTEDRYRDKLIDIVESVYTRELGMGGYETDEGMDLTVIYDTIMNDVQDYHALLDNVSNYFDKRTAYVEGIPSMWPVDYSEAIYITSGFGYRISPITGRPSFHPALDIAGPKGTPIRATARGKVDIHFPAPDTYWEGDENFGGKVELLHKYGYITRYGHMYKTIVHEGDMVERGEIIGYMGSTGRSTGVHVHYEVLRNGAYVNPIKLLQF